MTATAQKLAALFAKSSTPTLVTSLLALDAMPAAPEHSWARAKTIEELERRFPAAAEAVEAVFEEAENRIIAGEDVPDVDYVAVLIAAIPTEAL
jgi:hypothetical protein